MRIHSPSGTGLAQSSIRVVLISDIVCLETSGRYPLSSSASEGTWRELFWGLPDQLMSPCEGKREKARKQLYAKVSIV